ncbi:uncharacterized protein PpBr36_11153 [Pyricularia pennisetigena]|uniref:uncharacterized protein n=1 Tax=Pyricularia pennisetigena TaxID=1578925 RepID=UPI00114E594B|nr:uncharacterized protein PpBr36_11153 [Pyricularia pennisetigena]TLS20503.1 hypothetical protein PpBr36_11153 [Pyricularia pennisetigena]
MAGLPKTQRGRVDPFQGSAMDPGNPVFGTTKRCYGRVLWRYTTPELVLLSATIL